MKIRSATFLIVIIFNALFLFGCAKDKYWVHSAKGQEDFYRENSQCMAQGGFGQPSGNSVTILPGNSNQSQSSVTSAQAAMLSAQQSEANRLLRKQRNTIYTQCMKGFGWSLVEADALREFQRASEIASEPKKNNAANIRYQYPCTFDRGHSIHGFNEDFLMWMEKKSSQDLFILEQSCLRGETTIIDNLL